MYTESVRLRYKAGGKKALADFEKAIRDATRSAVIKDVETDANGPRDLARRFRFGSPPDPVRAPRLVVDDQQLLENGAWEIKGTVRLPKGRTGVTRGAPRLTFAGESGKRSTIKWDAVIAVKDCEIEDDRVLVIQPEVRSARFRATTNPSSNPVPATDAAVIVSFNIIEVNA
jgi:hypothetical protein